MRGGDDLEDDAIDHDRQDHGEHTAVAAPDPEPRGPEVLTKRLAGDPGRTSAAEPWRRGSSRPSRCPPQLLGLTGVRGHGVSRSGVMGSASQLRTRRMLPAHGTRCHVLHNVCRSNSAAGPSCTIRPRYSTRYPVEDLEDVVQVVGDDHHREPVVPQALGSRSLSTCRVPPPRGPRRARPAAPAWSSTSRPWPPRPTGLAAESMPLAGGWSAPWSPAGPSGSRPPSAPSSPRRAGRGSGVPAEEHVLDDVQVVGQRQVLVGRNLDLKRGGVPSAPDVYLPSLEEHLAVVRPAGARDAVGEHSFHRPRRFRTGRSPA